VVLVRTDVSAATHITILITIAVIVKI